MDSENTEKPKGVGGNGNLIPPVKGEVRNPNGRGKGVRNRSTIYRELIESMALKSTNPRLDEALKSCFSDQPKTIADQIAAAMVLTALNGDVSAAKEIMDSSYGKLTDKVNTTHSFKKMGKVVVEQLPDPSAGLLAGAPVRHELSFDVGEPAAEPENSIEEGENDDENNPEGRNDHNR